MIEKLKSHPNYGFNEQDNGRKLNEVIDELNSLQGLVESQQGLIELNRGMIDNIQSKEPPKGRLKETIHYLDMGKTTEERYVFPEVPPKKEENARWIKRENDYWSRERVAEIAVEAYKKRLVEKLETNRAGWISAGMPDEFIAGYKIAVTLVEATD